MKCTLKVKGLTIKPWALRTIVLKWNPEGSKRILKQQDLIRDRITGKYQSNGGLGIKEKVLEATAIEADNQVIGPEADSRNTGKPTTSAQIINLPQVLPTLDDVMPEKVVQEDHSLFVAEPIIPST